MILFWPTFYAAPCTRLTHAPVYHVYFCLRIIRCRRMLTWLACAAPGQSHPSTLGSTYGCTHKDYWLNSPNIGIDHLSTFIARMSLLDLLNELLLSIAESLRCESGINAFARTNGQLYCLLNMFLYQYHIRTSDHSALSWATHHGLTNTVLKFLDLGANVQVTLNNDKGVMALHLALKSGYLVIVEILI